YFQPCSLLVIRASKVSYPSVDHCARVSTSPSSSHLEAVIRSRGFSESFWICPLAPLSHSTDPLPPVWCPVHWVLESSSTLPRSPLPPPLLNLQEICAFSPSCSDSFRVGSVETTFGISSLPRPLSLSLL
ncbi:hypothetical protein T310_6660, partial [Rasamsonia emersonii CBS 393.64]